MCGRFSLFYNPIELKERFKVDRWNIEWKPSYNIAPGQAILTVNHGRDGLEANQTIWGYVPHWNKKPDPKIIINARAETISEKPSFKESFLNRRCLIIADGFYEWKKTPIGKQPYYIRLITREPFAFAGIYDTITTENGSITTSAIITTKANDLVGKIHDRMPVIISRQDEFNWLYMKSDSGTIANLLKTPDPGLLEFFPVDKHVNDFKNNDPGLIEPIEETPDEQKTMSDFTG